jgi:hypothetical protein
LKRHVSSLEEAGNWPRKAVFFQEDTKETVAEEERHFEGGNMADPKKRDPTRRLQSSSAL